MNVHPLINHHYTPPAPARSVTLPITRHIRNLVTGGCRQPRLKLTDVGYFAEGTSTIEMQPAYRDRVYRTEVSIGVQYAVSDADPPAAAAYHQQMATQRLLTEVYGPIVTALRDVVYDAMDKGYSTTDPVVQSVVDILNSMKEQIG